MTTEIRPWDRQKGESSKAYQAFVAYRDMGPTRSLRSVASQLGKSSALIERWSRRDHWQDRIAAWETELSRREMDAIVEMRKDALELHRRAHRQMLNVALRRLVGDPAHDVKPIDPNRLSAFDLVRMFDTATRWERVSLGLAMEGKQEVEARITIDQARAEMLELAKREGFTEEETAAAVAEVERLMAQGR